jgi:hypothetical protein
MKTYICAVSAGVLGLLSSSALAAPIAVLAGDPWILSPSDASATVLTFDELQVGVLLTYQFDGGTLTGSGAIEDTSLVGKFAQPAGHAGNYLTVSYPAAAGAVQFVFSTPENYFGLYWGSIDAYNSITFRKDGEDLATFSGIDIGNLAGLLWDGSWQAASSNRYINFYTGANFYDEVVLNTTNYGFEVANIAFGDPPVGVPEPGSLILLGSMFSCFAVVRRRRTRNSGW